MMMTTISPGIRKSALLRSGLYQVAYARLEHADAGERAAPRFSAQDARACLCQRVVERNGVRLPQLGGVGLAAVDEDRRPALAARGDARRA